MQVGDGGDGGGDGEARVGEHGRGEGAELVEVVESSWGDLGLGFG